MKPKVIIGIVVVVLILVGGGFYFAEKVQAPIPQPVPEQPITTPMPTSTPVTIPTSTEAFSLSPASGPVGTTVTIHGSGFTADNKITMNGLVAGSMESVASVDGKTLTFQIPVNLGPDCNPNQACPQFMMAVSANDYKIAVTTNGVTQPIGTFTVTGAYKFPGQ